MNKLNDIKNYALKHMMVVYIAGGVFILLIVVIIICIKCRKRNRTDKLEADVKNLIDSEF